MASKLANSSNVVAMTEYVSNQLATLFGSNQTMQSSIITRVMSIVKYLAEKKPRLESAFNKALSFIQNRVDIT